MRYAQRGSSYHCAPDGRLKCDTEWAENARLPMTGFFMLDSCRQQLVFRDCLSSILAGTRSSAPKEKAPASWNGPGPITRQETLLLRLIDDQFISTQSSIEPLSETVHATRRLPAVSFMMIS
jgi:hypothetical protein